MKYLLPILTALIMATPLSLSANDDHMDDFIDYLEEVEKEPTQKKGC